ncbi:hypothetical protein K501DRAFT_171162 [Backusella circina FSU 941]|nr:hypothetical protein K501DRAFT_177821 [Backusella circina FSU 941]KAI8889309.1 hypothetical protein K501DRAFT_171162 [Backusella circina FSU 941]
MQLIANELGSGKKPPPELLSILINFILQPKTKIKTRHDKKRHFLACRKAYHILLDVLHLFGSSIFNRIWMEFGTNTARATALNMNGKRKRQSGNSSDSDEDMFTKYVGEFEDLWQLIRVVLKYSKNTLESVCRRYVADLLVKVLKCDVKSKKGIVSTMKKSKFISLLSKDTLGICSKFDKILEMITQHMPYFDERQLEVATDLLNMLITITCYNGLGDQNGLLTQMYKYVRLMTGEMSQQTMEMIRYPSFIIALCDLALSDVDVSRVDEHSLHFRKSKHKPLYLDKIFKYVFRTSPSNIQSIDDIYKHVLIVYRYCETIFTTSSIRAHRLTNESPWALADDQLIYLLEYSHESVDYWEAIMESLIEEYNDDHIKEKIRWLIKFTKLTVTCSV